MSAEQISIRYAQSLFNLAHASKCVEDVHLSLSQIGEMVKAVPSLREFIHNPLIGADERNKVLTAVFSAKTHDLVMKFLLFVSIKNRLNLLENIIVSFDTLYLKAQNKVRASIVMALDIGDDEKKHVLEVLSRTYNKSIVADWQLNANLIGGFKIFIEGKLHDSSFTSQLEEYKQKVLR